MKAASKKRTLPKPVPQKPTPISLSGKKIYSKIQQLALSLPEAHEVEAWGHPTFRVRNKIFASFGWSESGCTLGVKTTPMRQAELVETDPRFKIAAYVGKHGWVSMSIQGKIDWKEIEMLMQQSYRFIAPPALARGLIDGKTPDESVKKKSTKRKKA